MTTKWDIIKDKTGVEAGYVNHPDDKGGPTNFGITQTTAREYKHLWSKYSWDGNMRTLPLNLALEIYDLGWWKAMKLDEVFSLSPDLAERMFDFGINAGRANAGKALQRVLNVLNKKGTLYKDISVDGSIGPGTISALTACIKSSKETVLNLELAMFGMQTYHYIDISEKREDNESFTNGWLNRVRRDAKIYWTKLIKG